MLEMDDAERQVGRGGPDVEREVAVDQYRVVLGFERQQRMAVGRADRDVLIVGYPA
jgi:hypothetical protein